MHIDMTIHHPPMPATVNEAKRMLIEEFVGQIDHPRTWAQIDARSNLYRDHLYALGVTR